MKKLKLKIKNKNKNAFYRLIAAPSSSAVLEIPCSTIFNSVYLYLVQSCTLTCHADECIPHTHKVQKRAADAGHVRDRFRFSPVSS